MGMKVVKVCIAIFMVINLRENIDQVREMEKEKQNMRMEQHIKVISSMITLKSRVRQITLIKTNIKENFKKEKKKDKESMFLLMVTFTKDNGKMTAKEEWVQ